MKDAIVRVLVFLGHEAQSRGARRTFCPPFSLSTFHFLLFTTFYFLLSDSPTHARTPERLPDSAGHPVGRPWPEGIPAAERVHRWWCDGCVAAARRRHEFAARVLASGHQRAVRVPRVPAPRRGVCHPQRAGDLRARRRPRARAVPDGDAGSPARRRIRRILSRRGHRPRRARRGGARWHRDRGSFDQQAQHGAAGRRRPSSRSTSSCSSWRWRCSVSRRRSIPSLRI